MLRPTEIMKIAFEEAKTAFREGEVPIGAVLFFEDGELIKDHNRKRQKGVYAHAEFNVLRKALKYKTRNLENAILYVTLEPCLMCIGAMIEARIGGLVYSTDEPKFGGIELLKDAWKKGKYPHKFPIHKGILKDESEIILKKFFERKR